MVEFARPFRMPDFILILGLFLAQVIDRSLAPLAPLSRSQAGVARQFPSAVARHPTGVQGSLRPDLQLAGCGSLSGP